MMRLFVVRVLSFLSKTNSGLRWVKVDPAYAGPPRYEFMKNMGWYTGRNF